MKKDPRNQGLFNLSGLSRAATGTNVSLDDGGAEVTDCRRKRKQGKPVYCQHMLHYGISGHFQALAYVLTRHIKSVSRKKKKKTQKVGVAGFDSLRNVYIYFFY